MLASPGRAVAPPTRPLGGLENVGGDLCYFRVYVGACVISVSGRVVVPKTHHEASTKAARSQCYQLESRLLLALEEPTGGISKAQGSAAIPRGRGRPVVHLHAPYRTLSARQIASR